MLERAAESVLDPAGSAVGSVEDPPGTGQAALGVDEDSTICCQSWFSIWRPPLRRHRFARGPARRPRACQGSELEPLGACAQSSSSVRLAGLRRCCEAVDRGSEPQPSDDNTLHLTVHYPPTQLAVRGRRAASPLHRGRRLLRGARLITKWLRAARWG